MENFGKNLLAYQINTEKEKRNIPEWNNYNY